MTIWNRGHLAVCAWAPAAFLAAMGVSGGYLLHFVVY